MKKDNMQAILILVAILFVNIWFISAHGEETFAQAEEIIKQKLSCENLTEEQLEILGDYYMEQMHPGELHEIMDERIGGEGSESLRQAHISMGLAFYCGEHQYMSIGMMNLMMGRGTTGYAGMMGNYYDNTNGSNAFAWLFNFLLIAGLVLLIVLLVKQIKK